MNDNILRKIKPCALNRSFIFVSYSAKDKEVVYRDVYELQLRGWNVWLDEKNLDKSNSSWTDDALKAIEDIYCELGLFYVSKNSLCSDNCYREMEHTDSQETKLKHANKPVKFIAVEVEEIGDIVKYDDNLAVELKNSNLPKREKEKQIECSAKSIQKLFNLNNERVRIKPVSTYPSEDDYYNAIEEQFRKSGLKPTETNNLPRIKIYRDACAILNVAKTETEYKKAIAQFRRFIDSFPPEQHKSDSYFDLCDELKDAIIQVGKCEEKAEECRKDAVYAQAMKMMEKNTIEDYTNAETLLDSIKGWKKADEKAEECRKGIERIYEGMYQDAMSRYHQANNHIEYIKAAEAFEQLKGYRDSKEMAKHLREASKAKVADEYVKAIRKLSEANTREHYTALARSFGSLNGYMESRDLQVHCNTVANKIRRNKEINRWRILVEAILAVMMFLFGLGTGCNISQPEEDNSNIQVDTIIPSSSSSNEDVEIETVDQDNQDLLSDSKDGSTSGDEDQPDNKYWKLSELVNTSSIFKGDTVIFGRYEQDNNLENDPEDIEWIVLDKEEDGTLLLLSKYALDAGLYDGVTWESCSLREWLYDEDMENNPNTFYAQAFDDHEKAMVFLTDTKTNGSEDTHDKVYLLSVAEASDKKYFSDDEARQCKPTDYAISRNVYVNENTGACPWWLRSPGNDGISAARVYDDGSVRALGFSVNNDYVAVRPACRVNPES